ncbi:MAG: NfeD family protein [Betaproteobacteria bacterium]|jgi:membrane protein implicated in regulation of membrane protease activity
MTPALLWFVAGMILIILELLSGTFYLLILGAGAFSGALVAVAGGPFLIQALAAAAAGVGGFLLVRRRRRSLQGGPAPAAIDAGQTAIFEAWVNADHRIARVRYRGATWEADVAGQGEPAAGTLVTVTAVDGVRLRVTLDPS